MPTLFKSSNNISEAVCPARKSALFHSSTSSSSSKKTLPVKKSSCLGGLISIAGYTLENYQKYDPEGYTILCETGKYCDALSFFPNAKTIVLETGSQTHMFFTDFPYKFVPGVANELQVSPEVAHHISTDFFSGNRVVVQPTGVQGTVYNMMKRIQNYGSMINTYEVVSIAKTTGMTGLKAVTNAPCVFIGATYVGGVFFSYLSIIAGHNPIGTFFNTTSYVLTLPMKGTEVVLNGIILGPISRTTGLPLILNATDQVHNGKGILVTDFAQIGVAFERVAEKTDRVKTFFQTVRKAWNTLVSGE